LFAASGITPAFNKAQLTCLCRKNELANVVDYHRSERQHWWNWLLDTVGIAAMAFAPEIDSGLDLGVGRRVPCGCVKAWQADG